MGEILFLLVSAQLHLYLIDFKTASLSNLFILPPSPHLSNYLFHSSDYWQIRFCMVQMIGALYIYKYIHINLIYYIYTNIYIYTQLCKRKNNVQWKLKSRNLETIVLVSFLSLWSLTLHLQVEILNKGTSRKTSETTSQPRNHTEVWIFRIL